MATTYYYTPKTNAWKKNLDVQRALASKKKLKDVKKSHSDESEEMSVQSIPIPGLEGILDRKRGIFFNIFWLLVISLSTLTCCYQIYDRFSLFVSGPIATKISLNPNTSVKFPSVTLCPLFPQYISESIKPLKEQKAKELGLKTCFVNPIDLINYVNLSVIWEAMSLDGIFATAISWSSFMVQGSEVATPEEIPYKSIFTSLGNCFQFNFDDLIPFQNEDYKLCFAVHKNLETSLCVKSAIMAYLFHNVDDKVTYKILVSQNKLSYNTTPHYSISARMFKVLNRTEKPCDKHSTVSECEQNCLENEVKSIITCRFPYMKIDIPLCSDYNSSALAAKTASAFAADFDYSERCNCPRKCEELLYTDKLALLRQGYVDDPGVCMYYSDNVIETIEEFYSYTIIPLMCDIGGNLGLFLGLCIPAIAEIVESVVVLIAKRNLHLRKE